MRNPTLPLWLAALAVIAAPAWAMEHADGWPLDTTSMSTDAGASNFLLSLAIVDEQSLSVVKLFQSQFNQPLPSTGKPKPRPRLGDRPASTQDGPGAAQQSYDTHLEEALNFIGRQTSQIGQRWNSPLDASDSLQWTHEIDAECVFTVNKRSGVVSIESLTDAPDSAEMTSLRQCMLPTADDLKYIGRNSPAELALVPREAKAVPSAPAELERLKRLILAQSPMTVPDVFAILPGENIKLRLTFKVARFYEETNSYVPPAGGSKRSPVNRTRSNPATRKTPAQMLPDPIPTERASEPRVTDVNDPRFHFAIGLKYINGDGLPRDYKMALYHIQAAASAGYAPAQGELGTMYRTEMGVGRDYEKAIFWYRKAADQGDGDAIYNIGTLYQNGEGVVRDVAEGTKWTRKAAEMGLAYAQSMLSFDYTEGFGVAPDPVEAFQWSLKAAKQNYAFAQFTVGRMYEEGRGIAKDEREALAWYNLSPTSGLADKTDYQDRLERRLGPEAAAKAHQRAEELRAEIRQAKAGANH